MSATTNPVAGNTQVLTIPTALTGAVDAYDVAARMEATGHGISHSLRAGYPSTFAHARALMPRETHHVRTRVASEFKIHGGWPRTVVLVSGVALCLLMLAPQSSPLTLFLAAGATWSTSQVLSAVLWTGIGRGELANSARIALVAAVASLVVAGLTGVFAGWAVLGWAAWGVTAAVGNSLFPGRRFAQICAAAAITPSLLFLWNPAVARLVVAAMVTLALAWAMKELSRQSIRHARMDRGLVNATALALVQSLSLQAGLVGLYLLHPESFTVIALAGFLLAVLLETLLDYITGFTRSVAALTTSWRRARRSITWIAITATAAGGLAGYLMCAALGIVLSAGEMSPGTYQAALILGVLMTASGLLLRCGSAAGAAVISATGAALMLVEQVLDPTMAGSTTSVLLVVAFSMGTATVVAHHVAAPRNW